MNYQEGDLIIGKVVKVKPYALFLSFENGQEALLHISELSDSYVKDIETFGTVGDELKVKVLDIDNKNGFMRVSYKQVPQSESYSSHNESNRHIISKEENEFSLLKEKLPTWIEETLRKKEEK